MARRKFFSLGVRRSNRTRKKFWSRRGMDAAGAAWTMAGVMGLAGARFQAW
jgi:hypothetical protein